MERAGESMSGSESPAFWEHGQPEDSLHAQSGGSEAHSGDSEIESAATKDE